MVSLALQVYAFLVTVLTGILVSLCFDLYRAWRATTSPRGLRSDLDDLGFWLWGTLLVGAGIFLSNWGELRFYVPLGLGAGGLLYFQLASPTILPAARRIFALMARGLRRLGNAAARPVRGAWRGGRRLRRRAVAAVKRGVAALRRMGRWLRHLPGFF